MLAKLCFKLCLVFNKKGQLGDQCGSSSSQWTATKAVDGSLPTNLNKILEKVIYVFDGAMTPSADFISKKTTFQSIFFSLRTL